MFCLANGPTKVKLLNKMQYNYIIQESSIRTDNSIFKGIPHYMLERSDQGSCKVLYRHKG